MDWRHLRHCLVMCLLLTGLLIGCGGSEQSGAYSEEAGRVDEHDHDGDTDHAEGHEHDHSNEGGVLALPALAPINLDGGKLQVVATTSIIGDVAAQVGGDLIELTTLMGPGQDPHSYEPGARELTAVAHAHIILINGWDLEEGLLRSLTNIGDAVPFAPVSAGIQPRQFAKTGAADPHVWLDPHNVVTWTDNIQTAFSALDPANAAAYAANAAAYKARLTDLMTYADEQLSAIPAAQRKLVTNHGAFGYFADRYDFQVVGTVLPAFSSLAEPSASELSALVQTMRDENVCAIFAETTANDQLAQSVAAELDTCTAVQVLPLYTGALGPIGSGADSYIGMIRANIDMIVKGLGAGD